LATVVQTRPDTRPAESWDEVVYGPERFRPLHLLRTTPVRIWLLTALFGLVLASWSVLVPQYHAPDEPNHTDAVMRLVQGKGWPHPGAAAVTPDGVGAIANSPFGTRERPYELGIGPIPEQDAPSRADRPNWDELGAGQPAGAPQQIVQHPPLYYAVGATVLRLLPHGGDNLRWDVVIGTLRLLSVLMVAPLPLLAYHGTRRLTDDENAATVAAVFPLAIPQLTHIGSTVNNDNLLVLTSGLATVAVVYVLRGDTTLRTAAFTGSFVGLALFTKSLAIVFVPMAALAYLVAWRRARRAAARAAAAGPGPVGGAGGASPSGTEPGGGASEAAGAGGDKAGEAVNGRAPSALRRDTAPFHLADAPVPAAPASALRFPWRQLLLGGVIMLALGGWWWVVNIVRYHTFQPETPNFPAGKRIGDDWNAFGDHLFNGTVGRFWGGFGWFEVNLSRSLTYTASAIVVVLFALGLVRARGGQARTNLLFLLWPTLGLFALMAYQATSHFRETQYVTGISGRYLFAGVVSLAIGVGAGAAALARRGTGPALAPQHSPSATGKAPALPPRRRSLVQWLPLLLLTAAAAMQVYAASLIFEHFWQPDGGGWAQAWGAMAAWSPWSPTTLRIVGWLTVAAAASAFLACAVHGLRRTPRPHTQT
jgi:small subunit ribosomal protein S36